MRTKILLLVAFAFLLVGWLAMPDNLQAQVNSHNRLYYYPYYYFPHNYAPEQTTWPDPRQKFQRPPAYMSYPPRLDPMFKYQLFMRHRYYRGFHFWLDQF